MVHLATKLFAFTTALSLFTTISATRKMSQVVEGIDFLRKHMNEANTDPEVLEAMELLREQTACEAQVTQELRDRLEPNDQPMIECDEKKMLESSEQVNNKENT